MPASKRLNSDADFVTDHILSLLTFSTNITVQTQKEVKTSKLYTSKKKKSKMFLWLKAYYEFIIQAEKQVDDTGLQIAEYVVKDTLRNTKYTKKSISSCIIPIRSYHPCGH